MERIERLRRMAKEALHEYQVVISAGGEPSYPQWADDLLSVCDLAEFAANSPLHIPARQPEHRDSRRHLS